MNHTVLARCPWTPSSKLICMETFLLSIHKDTNLHSMFQAGRDLSLGQYGHPWPHFKDVCKPTTIILCFLIRQEGVSLLSRHVRLGRNQSDSDFDQICECPLWTKAAITPTPDELLKKTTTMYIRISHMNNK